MRRSRSDPTRRAGRGFTIIELLVVMAVIAILLALLVPTLSKIRDHVRRVQTQSMIGGIGMALETYKEAHLRYPPDQHPGLGGSPGLDLSSECLIYYLSGGSMFYDALSSPVDYPWHHNLYNIGVNGGGRKAMSVYYEFTSNSLADFDDDDAPELIDPWQHRLIYNAGSTTNGDWNQYAAPMHRLNKFDLFSAATDGQYGNDEDITNWDNALWDEYDLLNSGEGTEIDGIP